MKRPASPRRGRPPHTDDPPVFVGTTLPTSTAETLNALSAQLKLPKSAILTEAIRAYARRVKNIPK